jgi:hypothetical protein
MQIASRPWHHRFTKMQTVDRDTLISYTWCVVDPVTQARIALRRAEATLKRRQEELAAAIAEAVRNGEKLSHVAARAGYTREHVRRLVRAAGIEDTTGREPPPPRYTRSSPNAKSD